MKKPEKKIIPYWILVFASVTVPVSLVLTFGLVEFRGYSLSRTLLPLVFTGLLSAFVLGYVRYRAWRYTLRDDHAYLEHGIFVKVRTMVPYVRVQHIDTRRTVTDRVLGLSRLVIYTAGSRGADVTIPGLLPEDAEDMQKKLRDLAIESEDRDGV